MMNRLMQAVSVVRLKPFDTSSAEGRSRERYRRAALSALGTAAASGVSVIAGLITVPLTITYLGTERYGLWMTVNSIINILTYADLGLGNGLLNVLSEANGKDDRQRSQVCVSSAFAVLSFLGTLLVSAFALSYRRISWAQLFNVSSTEAAAEAGPTMAVLAGCLVVNMPLGIAARARIGYQEGYVNSMWNAAGSVLGLVGVLLAIHNKAGLPVLVTATAGAPALALAANWVWLFGRQRPWLRPRFSAASWSTIWMLLRTGALFFIIQVIAAVMLSSDNVIIAQVLGPAQVSEYAVPARLFNLGPWLLGMVLATLWPAYGESIARGETSWARTTFMRSIKMALLGSVVPGLLLVLFGRGLIHVWVGDKIHPSFPLLAGLAAWTVALAVGSAVATLLNGANVLLPQAAVAIVTAVLGIPLKILLARTYGIAGVAWATLIAFGVISGVPYYVIVSRLLRRLRTAG